MKKKGFTLVELLTVIVVLGILMTGSIIGVSTLIDKAKSNRQDSQKNALEMAVKSYTTKNLSALPKGIGETRDIYAITVKNAKFLKEDIMNSNNKSCMENSFVRINKIEKDKYKYTTYLYCEGDTIPEKFEKEIPVIDIEISPTEATISYKGNENETLEISGYSYVVSAIYKNSASEPANPIEVYRSEFFKGNNKKAISITVALEEYAIIGKITRYIVTAEAYNEDGGYAISNAMESTPTMPVVPEQPGSISPDPDNSIKVGDYFTLVPDANTYTISTNLTGYRVDQTITPSELTLWRVISASDNIEAVSEYISSENVYFTGSKGYSNYIGTLQIIAQQYEKTGYTVASRIIGYDGQTFITQTPTSYSYNSTPTPTSGTGQEYNNGLGGDTLYLRDYQLVSNVYKSDSATYSASGLTAYVVGTSTTKNYWIASRRFKKYAFIDNGSKLEDSKNFCGRYVYSTTGTNGGKMDLSHSSSRFYYHDDKIAGIWRSSSSAGSIRPIITLDSSIKINGGSGTKVDPYTLTK